MINIVCFKWGREFSPDYVNNLYNSIKRNTTVPINFICYTENPMELECETRPFLEPLPHWWYIIGLFNPKHGFKDKVVYLDLDTIVTGNIDHIISLDKSFATIRDFYRPNGLQTAYIMWEPDWGSFIWNKLAEQFPPKKYNKLLGYAGGTNAFLERSVGTGDNVCRLQDEFPEELISYKVHIKPTPDFKITKEKLVFFHGKPRPHEVRNLPWMVEHWR